MMSDRLVNDRTVAIVYFSAQGHTHQLAEAVAEGVAQVPGVAAKLLRIAPDDLQGGRFKNDQTLAACAAADAIVFGTPTYMGGVSAQMKAFIDAASSAWFRLAWKDKLAGGFTHSLGLSGDKFNTLLGLFVNAQQHGMVWIGTGVMVDGTGPEHVNRLSSYIGPMAQSDMQQQSLHAGDRQTAVGYGKRIAEAVVRWHR
jgi:NAD(P)H dehydrogenase (quinone)